MVQFSLSSTWIARMEDKVAISFKWDPCQVCFMTCLPLLFFFVSSIFSCNQRLQTHAAKMLCSISSRFHHLLLRRSGLLSTCTISLYMCHVLVFHLWNVHQNNLVCIVLPVYTYKSIISKFLLVFSKSPLGLQYKSKDCCYFVNTSIIISRGSYSWLSLV